MADLTQPTAVEAELSQVFLQEADLAKRLKLSIKSIQSWRLKGEGPVFLKLGRRGAVRYRMRDVLAWEATCVRRSTSSEVAVIQFD